MLVKDYRHIAVAVRVMDYTGGVNTYTNVRIIQSENQHLYLEFHKPKEIDGREIIGIVLTTFEGFEICYQGEITNDKVLPSAQGQQQSS